MTAPSTQLLTEQSLRGPIDPSNSSRSKQNNHLFLSYTHRLSGHCHPHSCLSQKPCWLLSHITSNPSQLLFILSLSLSRFSSTHGHALAQATASLARTLSYAFSNSFSTSQPEQFCSRTQPTGLLPRLTPSRCFAISARTKRKPLS